MIDLASSVRMLWESQLRPPVEPGETAGRSSPHRGSSLSGPLTSRGPSQPGLLTRRPASVGLARPFPSLRSGSGHRGRSASDACLSRPVRGGHKPRNSGKQLPTVRDLPINERPRERMAALGSQALSAPELLACLLGRGGSGESVLTIAQRLLAKFGSLDRKSTRLNSSH